MVPGGRGLPHETVSHGRLLPMLIASLGMGIVRCVVVFIGIALALSGCGSTVENVALGVASTTVLGARSPTDEIEQTYYLGVYDPQGQLPPSIYRVRVHGQSSFLNSTKFASGWVRAGLIDSLGTRIGVDETDGGLEIRNVQDDETEGIATGRRLMMFGPEGFREAPADHRLVVVMGADPSAFFEAVDQTLGVVAQATQGISSSTLRDELFEELIRLKSERQVLSDLAHQTSVQEASNGL